MENKNKSILITGIAGSGKTCICKELERRGYKAYGIEDMDIFFEMVDKETGKPIEDYDNADFEKVQRGKWMCDLDKLKEFMAKQSGLAFYCGTGTNINDSFSLFDKVFALMINEENLRKRLTTRTTNDFGRTKEVQDWILTWKGWWEEQMIERGAIFLNVNRDLEDVVDEILEKVNSI